jgi:hypothetical protein
MSTHFLVVALPRERFTELFALDDDALAARGIDRRTVPEDGGVPCRVSLEDAEPGETVLLLPFVHHDVVSPYRASGPIYVREQATTARLGPDELPAMLERRLLSLRAYDAQAMLQNAEVVEGTRLRTSLTALFAIPEVAYVDIHNARPGCFNCRALRVPDA